ncbi:MAG: imidazole glycerol phosphate synthase subunit HisH [Candidatus Omnitrophota bacterium]
MIGIVNYRMGNIRSVVNALEYLGEESKVIDTPEQILKADKLILPGVGSFRVAMEHINAMGFFDALNEAVIGKRVPILGICLGMQLLAEDSDEDGLTPGFGWIPGNVRRFPVEILGKKVPHIGFNTAVFDPGRRGLFGRLGRQADFYFVHSYRFVCRKPERHVSSWTLYGERFASSVENENIYGMQFHPEKSQSNGLTVLRNFCDM